MPSAPFNDTASSMNLAPTPASVSITAFRVAEAGPTERDLIYQWRHSVYARELHQHPENADGCLVDALDLFNRYLCVWQHGELAGFISITPAGHNRYSIDKYFPRESLPFAVDDRLFEVRLLTVLPKARGSETATLLLYAALRWVESRGGTRIVGIGRDKVLSLYLKAGMRPSGMKIRSGAVDYELIQAPTTDLRGHLANHARLLDRLESTTDWDLDVAFRTPAPCFHGGAFFDAIGPRFDDLARRDQIINADVLDAWFPPSPKVLAALEAHLPWLLRTSPPTRCEGLVETIAGIRGVKPGNILPGAGSSDLIFRARRHWLDRESSVLLLDPTYGEYAHVLERVIGCHVDRFTVDEKNGYRIETNALIDVVQEGYDLVVLVNPNSPTGQHLDRDTLVSIIRQVPRRTRVWIDETYIDYVGAAQSLEGFASSSDSVIVCKSMSKVYALSGARVAYLCAGAHQLEDLRAITPPWIVGLPAQVAAVEALKDTEYYAGCFAETHALRSELSEELTCLGWRVIPGCANFLLAHLPEDGPDAAELVARCAAAGLFIRNAAGMGTSFGPRVVRIAVKDRETNRRMIAILQDAAGRVGVETLLARSGGAQMLANRQHCKPINP